jgi:GxxExxY protein
LVLHPSYLAMTDNDITEEIIGAAIEVHKTLGPGLMESTYQKCLHHELSRQGLLVETEVPLPLIYKELVIESGYRVDLLVEKKLIVEVKAVERLAEIHLAQVLTYLKLANTRIGLLINFNSLKLVNGVKRVINKHFDESNL